ncbi:tetratricopeptide repeat protein [Archangium violaceum]|uniref:tetratricopeptide repeat protein n=1 Tax=Archangium violaceum TaxID=83451 RepID=UPI00195283C7|nr:tetratricopeptide repeat protein [Archangium violaceum]QRO00403.1 tetratricopeptide repeat protein [Archangium violaceum]
MAETSEISGSLVPLARREAMILLEAGYLWLDMGQFEKAREVFAGAAVLMPKSEVPQLALGSLEFAQGRHDKALQAYRAAQRLAPNSGLPRAHAAEALLFMGKVPEALKELKAAVDADPEGDGARLAKALMDAKDAGALPPPSAKK